MSERCQAFQPRQHAIDQRTGQDGDDDQGQGGCYFQAVEQERQRRLSELVEDHRQTRQQQIEQVTAAAETERLRRIETALESLESAAGEPLLAAFMKSNPPTVNSHL